MFHHNRILAVWLRIKNAKNIEEMWAALRALPVQQVKFGVEGHIENEVNSMKYLFNNLAYSLNNYLHGVEDEFFAKKEVELRKAIKEGVPMDLNTQKAEVLRRFEGGDGLVESSKKVDKYLKQLIKLEKQMSRELEDT